MQASLKKFQKRSPIYREFITLCFFGAKQETREEKHGSVSYWPAFGAPL
jgi:hypothetical protein